MLKEAKRIHIPGIGGRGIPGIARILNERGFVISGSDDWSSAALADLAGIGIDLSSRFEPECVEGADLVVQTPGVGADNVEIMAAHRAGIEVVSHSALLAQMLDGHRIVGVTGTHGKGTVTSMIAWILECAGLAPGFIASARLHNLGLEARDAQGPWFVVELNEPLNAAEAFLCDYMVCSFLDLSDRGGARKTTNDRVDSMTSVLELNRRLKEAFINLDCKGNRELVRQVAMRPTGYGVEHKAEYRASHTDGAGSTNCFDAFHRDRQIGKFELALAGQHNVVNALGAIAVTRRIGVAPEVVAEALKSYEGQDHRYTVASGGGVTIIKNFVDHPSQIKPVLRSAQAELTGQLVAVFEPYRVSLDDDVRRQLAETFAMCDAVVIVGERSEGKSGVEKLVRLLRQQEMEVHRLGEAMSDKLCAMAQPGDTIAFFGSDAFLEQADELQARLAIRAGQTAAKEEQPRLDGPLADGEQ